MDIDNKIIDEILKSTDPKADMFAKNGLLENLTARLIERALEAEMDEHLGYEHGKSRGEDGNARNGTGHKKVKTGQQEVKIAVPRDRAGSFEPQLVKKRQTRLTGFDERVLSLYARGMTVREIQGHLGDIYKTDVSPALISRVTDAVVEDVKAWRERPLQAVWPIVYLDALVVKAREQGVVQNRAAHLAIGVGIDGRKCVLGLWMTDQEGAKYWQKVLNELRNRGVEDILIACCDGLKGFPEAIEAVFPRTTVQTCIVHMIRNSLKYVGYKERKIIAAALKPVYTAPSESAAVAALDEFEQEWGERYPIIVQSWRSNWERVTPFLDYPPEIRKILYTTNAIESLNSMIRKLIRHRGHFPSEQSAIKMLYLALTNAEKKWTHPVRGWSSAMQQFALRFEGRLSL